MALCAWGSLVPGAPVNGVEKLKIDIAHTRLPFIIKYSTSVSLYLNKIKLLSCRCNRDSYLCHDNLATLPIPGSQTEL